MRNMAGRIKKLEELMRVGDEREIREIIISMPESNEATCDRAQSEALGPTETWLTVQEQLAAAREDQAEYDMRLIMVLLSPEKELQARERENSPVADEARAERIREYRTLLKDRYPKVAEP